MMMKRERVQKTESCCPSVKPAKAQSIFAPRPFAPKVEEHEAPAAGPGIGFNFGDISILPRETVQQKLVLGSVGDRYEQEADRVARRVVDTISSSDQSAVQRQEDLEDEEELDLEEEELRRKVDLSSAGGADVGPDLESAIQRARGRGQPLSDGVRQPMERAFGADFGGVRVHADGEADSLNRSLQARAFTAGQDIFLRQGEFRPGSSEGQRLLAHELTHVVQQNGVQLKHAQLLTTEEKSQNKIPARMSIDDEKIHRSGRVMVNARVIEFSDLIQRDYVNFAPDATLPENIKEFEINKKALHIFAHSSGRSLQQIDKVNGMIPREFANWLAKEGYIFNKNEDTINWNKQKSNIYIHACVSNSYTAKVAQEIRSINEKNPMTLHGTIGISATWFSKKIMENLKEDENAYAKKYKRNPVDFNPKVPKSGVLIVIKPENNDEWIKFEGNKNKTIDGLNSWAEKILLYPDGYDQFRLQQ